MRWHVDDRPGGSAATPDRIARALVAAQAADTAGEALGKLAGINELGRTSFASTVIAFLSPERAGIDDLRISKGLRATAERVDKGIAQGKE